MDVPVAFIIFNRPDLTRRTFDRIRQVKPSTLLVVADGARIGRAGEEGRCREARSIIDTIDWPCKLFKNYSETNLGCRERVSSGLNWVFSICDRAIVIEDDCLPDLTFFAFCNAMLDRYADDKRIMHVNGTNLHAGHPAIQESYYFSRYALVWGWASWRRAWKHYDVGLAKWPSLRDSSLLLAALPGRFERDILAKLYEDEYQGRVGTWDYQWQFACRSQNGLAVTPANNLVTNLGFGENATHTHNAFHSMAAMPTSPLKSADLTHPAFVLPNIAADEQTLLAAFEGREWLEEKKLRRRVHRALSRLKRSLKMSIAAKLRR